MSRGFTLIELLVVMAILSVLTMIAAPRYLGRIHESKEVVLRHNLATIREAIDQYVADRGEAPMSLEELVARHYLKDLPVDPITERSDTWSLIHREGGATEGLIDVRSGDTSTASDGHTKYSDW